MTLNILYEKHQNMYWASLQIIRLLIFKNDILNNSIVWTECGNLEPDCWVEFSNSTIIVFLLLWNIKSNIHYQSMISYFDKVKKCLNKIAAVKQCHFRQLWVDLLFRFIKKNSVQDLGTKLSQNFLMMYKLPLVLLL